MKQIALLFLLVIITKINTVNYYVSSFLGSNSNNGTSVATPWQTISKVNTMFSSLVAGDNVLFEPGGAFYGSIIVKKSGTITNPITLGDYGSGSKPFITGFTNATGFTNIGFNLWERSSIVSNNKPNMVLVNGKDIPIGRFPNSGYLTFENFVGNL